MKRTSFGDMPCPLARAVEHLSDSWNALILRECFYGSSHFDQFEGALGIASNTLTRRLQYLVENGLLERRIYNEKPPRYEYVLTDKGRDLRPVMLALMDWGNKHSGVPGNAVGLVDSTTGLPVMLGLIDERTGKRIGPEHSVVRRGVAVEAAQRYPFPENTDA